MIGTPVLRPSQGGFRSPDALLGQLTASDISALVTASSDIALVVDAGGLIRDVSVGDADLAARLDPAWIGQPLADTVTAESRGKVRAMLDTVPGDGLNWQEINHAVDGEDLPVRYVAVRLPAEGQLVVLGRAHPGLAPVQQQRGAINRTLQRG